MIGGLLVGAGTAGRAKPTAGVITIPSGGFALTAAGLFLGATTSLHSGYGFTAIWLVTMGVGLGLATTRTMTAALNALSGERAGVGSALIQAMRQVGGAIGTALLGAFANSGYRDRLTLSSLPPQITEALRGSVATGVQAAAHLNIPGLYDSVRAAFVGAMNVPWWSA